MTSSRVAIYGAYGHTGRLVTEHLRRRGHTLVLMGRDPEQIQALDTLDGERKLALPVDASWPAELEGVDFLVNCAGPFADTAAPLIEKALGLGADYIDTAGEPQVVRDVFERFDQRARSLNRIVLPATGFYGALGDLLAAAAAGDWPDADQVELDFVTDSWNPTSGTRAAAARMAGRRLVYSGGSLREETGQPQFIERDFGPPFGRQSVMQGYPSPEAILVPRHIATPTVAIGMGSLGLRDLRNAALTGPRAGEKSQQRFLVEARVHRRGESRSGRCLGQDIYWSTAPIIGEAISRLQARRGALAGVVSHGEAFDAEEFLRALSQSGLQTVIGG